MEFTSKISLTFVNDRDKESSPVDYDDPDADFTYESANKAAFKIENADLKDQQTGTIAYGYFPQDAPENKGYQFQPELLFKLNRFAPEGFEDLDFSGFDGNQIKEIAFVVPDSDASFFVAKSDRTDNDETWLQDGGYAANVNIGEAVDSKLPLWHMSR